MTEHVLLPIQQTEVNSEHRIAEWDVVLRRTGAIAIHEEGICVRQAQVF